ncbi:hypothetical protein IEQ34_006905 [Dendrobium chrysotoxum]|uniref:Uncharacterized protein n=1 Tax=Dendrobium chrysotoxum TaxID=161865 RepID=A0AAV7H8V9_DENCH|nr:hypothetical protein IEQ34_006905 [Dendrobium chrysotoxum]
MRRKTGVEVEGMTPSKASDDFPPGSDGDEIESELQKAFALEADDEGFGHRAEKRQMPDVPDLGTDSEIGVNWSKRLPRCDYCVCWPLQWCLRIVGLVGSHRRHKTVAG